MSRRHAAMQFVLEHLDGRKLLVSTPPGMVIKPGSLKGIRGEGMPIKGNRFDKVCRVPESAVGKRRAHVLACACVCVGQGVLFIHYVVDMPEPSVLTPQVRAALSAVLPGGEPVEESDEMQRCALVEMDPDESFRATQRAGGEAYESDDEDTHGRRGGGVQCAQQ